MKSLIRISLLLAAVAGLFVCGTTTFFLKPKITRFRADLQTEAANRKQAELALLEAQKRHIELSERLQQSQDELGIVAEERQTAVAAANILKLRLIESAGEKLNLARERDEARQELSRYQLAGLEPGQILKAALYIRELEASISK